MTPALAFVRPAISIRLYALLPAEARTVAKKSVKKRADEYWNGGEFGRRRCDHYPFDIEGPVIAAFKAGFKAAKRSQSDRKAE